MGPPPHSPHSAGGRTDRRTGKDSWGCPAPGLVTFRAVGTPFARFGVLTDGEVTNSEMQQVALSEACWGDSFPGAREGDPENTGGCAGATTDLKQMQEIGPESRGGPSGQCGALEAASSSRRHLRREPGRPAPGEEAFGMKPLREGTSPTPRPGGQPQTGHGSSPGPAETPVPWERVPSWGGPTPEGG